MSEDKREGIVESIRDSDVEPYTALRWVGTLFKAAAVFLAVATVGELIAGLQMEGARILPVLLGEAARTGVLAVVLWGAGDLVRLLIQLGNDVRAERILLSRLVYRTPPRRLDVGQDEGHDDIVGAESMLHDKERIRIEEGRRSA
jgi:hypothetical protein